MKYPGFDEFVEKLGKDTIDKMGKVEAMQAAFLGGRCYETERDRDALKNIDLMMAKRQA